MPDNKEVIDADVQRAFDKADEIFEGHVDAKHSFTRFMLASFINWGMRYARADHDRLTRESESLTLALENCRLLAARMHHKTNSDEWRAILGYCWTAGVKGSPLRSDEALAGKEK